MSDMTTHTIIQFFLRPRKAGGSSYLKDVSRLAAGSSVSTESVSLACVQGILNKAAQLQLRAAKYCKHSTKSKLSLKWV